MKIVTTLLLCLCTITSLNAQSKWSFGARVQGGFSGYSSTHSESHLLSGTTNQNFGYQEKRQPSVGLGFWWSKQWNEKWSLRGGVDYVWLNAYIAYNFSAKLLNGTPLSYSLSTYALSQQQLQLPLSIRYATGKTAWRFKPFAGIGLQLKFLTAEKREHVLTMVEGLQDGITFLTQEQVDFKNDYSTMKRSQLASHAEIGLKNDDVSLSISMVYSLQKGAIGEKAARRDYVCCLAEDSYNYFTGNGSFLFLQQTSLVFQYRLFK